MLARIGQTLMLGYTPEHNARRFQFDIAKWQEMWPSGTPRAVIQRPGEKTSYPAVSTVEGGVLTLTVTRYDTENPGTGKLWIAFVDGDNLLGLTPATTIYISSGPSMIDGDTPPEQTPPWIQQVLETAETVEKAGAAQVQAVRDEGAEQSAALAAQGDAERREVVAVGDAQEERLNQAVQGTVEAVVAEGERQNAAIAETAEAKKQEAVDAVNQVGAEQISAVESAGQEKVDAITAEGNRVLDSLPEDYPESIDAAKIELIDKLCPPFDVSGSVVTCNPVEGYPLHVVSRIDAVQEGEGDPSPDNVRPIVGWDAVTLVNGDKSYTTDLPETVYGGTLDWKTGVLTVDKAVKVFNGSEGFWLYSIGTGIFNTFDNTSVFGINIGDKKIGFGTSICNIFQNTQNGD